MRREAKASLSLSFLLCFSLHRAREKNAQNSATPRAINLISTFALLHLFSLSHTLERASEKDVFAAREICGFAEVSPDRGASFKIARMKNRTRRFFSSTHPHARTE